ncbi:ATP-binding protein [Streptomyces sp. NPDC058430]|uniref:ATP-binding protein n=1 Tax=Streptomyces sp. NPDC058430 TaxID=3346495 RepID=UPI0036679E1F
MVESRTAPPLSPPVAPCQDTCTLNGPTVPTPPAPTSWRIALPHTAAAVPVARALVRTALAEIESPSLDRDTAELLTAELVANAVEHAAGAGPIELVVELLASGCQVEVHDGDPAPPGDLTRPGPAEAPDPWQEHGRGLLLIRTLSSSCGHRPTASGKAVWFTLPAVPAQRRSPE